MTLSRSATVWRVLAGVACCGVAVAQFIDYGVYGLRIQVIDSLTNKSIEGVASLSALAAAAVVGGWVAARRGETSWWALTAALAVVFAARIVHPAHVVALTLPVIVVAFVLLLTRRGEPARTLFRQGAIVLAGSLVLHAVGTEVVHLLGYGTHSWAYQAKAVLKHAGELAGWVLVLGGMTSAAAQLRRPRVATTVPVVGRTTLGLRREP